MIGSLDKQTTKQVHWHLNQVVSTRLLVIAKHLLLCLIEEGTQWVSIKQINAYILQSSGSSEASYTFKKYKCCLLCIELC